MFGKPKVKHSRKEPGLGNLAGFLLSPSKLSSVGIDELLSTTTGTNTTAESEESVQKPVEIEKPTRTVKTGDNNSYWVSANDDIYIPRSASKKGYRVLSYKKTKSGKRKVFDILDGKQYYCGAGVQRRITDNAVVFQSKHEALSERFPSNQFAAGKSGNGRHPRMLVTFDVWGQCKVRHGGIPSLVCEFVRYMSVVEYLDPPTPLVSRLVFRNNLPFNFPGPDKSKPNRQCTEYEVKKYRMFNLKKKIDIEG